MTDIVQQLRQQKAWIVLLLVCFLIQFLQLAEWFNFDRQLILDGQWWRLLTAHFTHSGWWHFYLNMAGLLMVALFFSAYRSSSYWVGVIVLLSLLISLGLMLDQQLDRYVGFSGVLHGLFIIGGYYEYRRYKWSGLILLLLLAGKLLWEQLFGALPGSESMLQGQVAINAHLYGGLVGVLLCVWHLLRQAKQ